MTEKRKSANGGLHSLTRREKLYVAIAVPTVLVGMVGLVATVILLMASFFLLVPRLGSLDRTRCTQKQARAALVESAARCSQMLADALASPGNRVKHFRRDGWARPWPAGAAMFAYMVSHDVHHRGQVCMLARQLGFSLPGPAAYGIWNWEKLWRECGVTHPR